MAETIEPEASEQVQAALDTGGAAMAAALDEARDDPSLRDEVAAFFQAQRHEAGRKRIRMLPELRPGETHLLPTIDERQPVRPAGRRPVEGLANGVIEQRWLG